MENTGMNDNEENALLKALVDAVCYREQPIPKGFRTTQEWVEKTGFHRGKVGQILNEGIKAGSVEKLVLRRKVSGVMRYVPFYKLKKKG